MFVKGQKQPQAAGEADAEHLDAAFCCEKSGRISGSESFSGIRPVSLGFLSGSLGYPAGLVFSGKVSQIKDFSGSFLKIYIIGRCEPQVIGRFGQVIAGIPQVIARLPQVIPWVRFLRKSE